MIGEAKKRYSKTVSSYFAVIFGITLTVYCALVIHQRLRTQVIDSQLLMSFFTLFLALYIINDEKRDIMTAMGLYSLGMALTRLPSALLYIFTYPEQGSQMFVVGAIFLVIACNMLYSSWMYLHGICRGYITSTLIIMGLWIFYSGMLAASLYGILPDVSGTIFERVLDKEILLANVILFSAYIIVLGTDEMHDTTEMEKTCTHIESFSAAGFAGNDASLSRTDAKAIFDGETEWKKLDNQPASSEYRFYVSYTYNTLFGTAQKWKGDDRIFITISASDWDESLVQGTRFSADKIKCENGDIDHCTHLLFYSKNGDAVRIEVRDDNYEVIT